MSSNPVCFEREDALLTVTLSRPVNGNALSTQVVEALVECLEELAYDESVRVVLLRAEGKHFCSGLNLKDPSMSPTQQTPAALWAIQRSILFGHATLPSTYCRYASGCGLRRRV
jgi:enoyl-CoA hydratase/carnithine racemase